MKLVTISKVQSAIVELNLDDVKELIGALATHYDSLKNCTIGQEFSGRHTAKLMNALDKIERRFS
jgi:hypothetical protein